MVSSLGGSGKPGADGDIDHNNRSAVIIAQRIWIAIFLIVFFMFHVKQGAGVRDQRTVLIILLIPAP